jgi:hypothetical protein
MTKKKLPLKYYYSHNNNIGNWQDKVSIGSSLPALRRDSNPEGFKPHQHN